MTSEKVSDSAPRVKLPVLTRGECAEWLLPCELKACRHHLDAPKQEPIVWHLGRSYTSAWRSSQRWRARVLSQAKARMLAALRPIRIVDADDQVLETIHPSCALDFADRGPLDLGKVGRLLGVSKERVRQVTEGCLPAVRRSLSEAGFDGRWSGV